MKFIDAKGVAHLWENIKALVSTKQDLLVSGTTLKTVNGVSLLGGGNVNIDLSIYRIVTSLPTSNIDVTKIYLISNGQTSGNNVYTEYIYVNSKWEILGEFKSAIDLSPYAKTTDVNAALANKAGLSVATTSANGLMSSTDKTKLDGIASGAEVNQNAFAKVTVGNSTIEADAKTDTLILVEGDNVTLTPDTTNDKVTIKAVNTTYGTATASASGLMSASDKSKLNGIDASATLDASLTTAEIDAAIANA